MPISEDSHTKTQAPYGTWPAEITSTRLTESSVRLTDPQLDQGHCYWLEQRPEEKGRSLVVCQEIDTSTDSHIKGKRYDVSPKNVSVRTKAHEYGGACYKVDQGQLYYVDASDQRVYTMPVDGSKEPQVLSPENSEKVAYRYADFFVDHTRQQLLCVCEIERKDTSEPESNIISLKLDGSSTVGFNVLVFGSDFYSNPSVSPDGDKLAWLSWNHPNMPWDNSECWVADFNALNMLHKHRKVAGGEGGANTKDKGESIFQPQWSPTGDLLFVSDRSNWWNIYSYNTYNKYIEPLVDMPGEFATPQWVFGMSTYGFLNSYTLFCTYTQNGQWYLATIDLMSYKFTQLEVPFTAIEGVCCQDDNDSALFLAASPETASELIHWTKDAWQVISKSSPQEVVASAIAKAEAISFHNSDNEEVHGFYYAPCHSQYCGPVDEKPPLIVMCHGGPTGATSSALNLKIQFWTNRGFAVFDINYSGSTGYGRDYRRRLYPQWGLKDVDDLCAGAKYLAAQGLVDAERMAIRGSSAGGYSVLAALTFHNIFKAGASLYGIGDLTALAKETHKFESRYCDQLVGAYPAEEARYKERSPLYAIDKLSCPVIFLQGLEDKVVPPNQAQDMVDALAEKQIPVAYVTFAEEGHGFRQAENIRYSLDVEYAFYARVFGLEAQDSLVDVPFVYPKACEEQD